jgi:hypothetical protein
MVKFMKVPSEFNAEGGRYKSGKYVFPSVQPV